MAIFAAGLSETERWLFGNIKKTKSAFPEETQAIEHGLALMCGLIEDVNEAVKKDARPQLYANRNLFARNRELLLNAYFCMLCSNYGTQFVILRTVLENNDLIRLFSLHPQYAYEWLSAEKQKQFSPEIRLKYSKSSKHDREFKDWRVRKQLFEEIKKEKVAKDLKKIYSELCDYAHPNFTGWHELMGSQGKEELALKTPAFTADNASVVVGLNLYLMQLSFKTLFETFKGYISGFAVQLDKWQRTFNELMVRYAE